MSDALQLRHEVNRHVDIETTAGVVLLRYVYAPVTPGNESRRPFAHPVRSLDGEVLTNHRPNDHPWHHGLSLTITQVDGVNFWGGPSHRPTDGYQWRDDHGSQIHRGWDAVSAPCLDERLDWCDPKGAVLLNERRRLEIELHAQAWSLRWTSTLTNAAGRTLLLGNYHSLGGLVGSHYTGLQFRGARDLLDEHGDSSIGVTADGGLSGESAVHAAGARWMEWSCQHDGSLRRTRIRFENLGEPLPWFVRARNPLAAFAFHRGENQSLARDATLRLDHRLTFSRA
jgi:hypothetical protein